jgi:hypothetical protein
MALITMGVHLLSRVLRHGIQVALAFSGESRARNLGACWPTIINNTATRSTIHVFFGHDISWHSHDEWTVGH